MSTPFKTDITAEARLGYQELLLSYLRGESAAVLPSEQLESIEQTELDDHVDTMTEEAAEAGTRGSAVARFKLVLGLAVQRDAYYAAANRRWLFAQGMNSKLREDFSAHSAASIVAGGPL
jgi:hypothetical protein